jgi:hypothetical protein
MSERGSVIKDLVRRFREGQPSSPQARKLKKEDFWWLSDEEASSFQTSINSIALPGNEPQDVKLSFDPTNVSSIDNGFSYMEPSFTAGAEQREEYFSLDAALTEQRNEIMSECEKLCQENNLSFGAKLEDDKSPLDPRLDASMTSLRAWDIPQSPLSQSSVDIDTLLRDSSLYWQDWQKLGESGKLGSPDVLRSVEVRATSPEISQLAHPASNHATSTAKPPRQPDESPAVSGYENHAEPSVDAGDGDPASGSQAGDDNESWVFSISPDTSMQSGEFMHHTYHTDSQLQPQPPAVSLLPPRAAGRDNAPAPASSPGRAFTVQREFSQTPSENSSATATGMENSERQNEYQPSAISERDTVWADNRDKVASPRGPALPRQDLTSVPVDEELVRDFLHDAEVARLWARLQQVREGLHIMRPTAQLRT